MSVFAENRGGAMVISTLVETGRVRVELECSNSRGMSQTAAAQPGTRSSPRQQFSENWKSQKIDRRVGLENKTEFWF